MNMVQKTVPITKIEFQVTKCWVNKRAKEKAHCPNNLSVHRNRIFSTLSTWRVNKKPRVTTVKPVKATTDIILSPAFLYKKHTNKKQRLIIISATLKPPFDPFTFRERRKKDDEARRSPSLPPPVRLTSDESNRRAAIHRTSLQETSQHFPQRRHRRPRLRFFLRLFLRGHILRRRR